MLKFLLADERGVISWLLSQIGLLLATGILLASIASLTFYSDWQKEAEAKVMASNFATAIESVYLKEFPGKSTYLFREKNYYYDVSISTEYITVRRFDGTFNKEITAREKILIQPWPNPEMRGGYGAEGFYNYFGSIYGSENNGSSPDTAIPESLIENEFNYIKRKLASHPFEINIDKPVYIERISLYVETNDKIERRYYVILYQ